MYLKALELVGFKSFADRTRLEFTQGMTAIVGPNGCGKSNISDAIRWVLGEQSAKLLRGSKMEDCIFNGTEKRKPLGMAEVSLTLADCEEALGTEFNEVTVTRRVFRSGEGQYFINKTPCRLRDIQRLFMDTGIGTSSYSLMEQGRIDLILSSHPEDRREVFEEASGITKYKTDKREALRKLEQTEANLLRLADIIKEVRRQIISLQRQAGKAARYKKHQEELRRLDIFAAREKLKQMDENRAALEGRLGEIRQNLERQQESVRQQEKVVESLRARMETAEKETTALQQKLMELAAQRDQARQTIELCRQRCQALENQSRREAGDAESATAELQRLHTQLEQTRKELAGAAEKFTAAQAQWQAHAKKLAAQEQMLAEAKAGAEKLQNESLACENRLAQIQNELHKLENEDRNLIIRRERCAVEAENLKMALTEQEKHAAELAQTRTQLQQECQAIEQQLAAKEKEALSAAQALRAAEAQSAELRSQEAAAIARVELLEQAQQKQSGFSQTARKLLQREVSAELSQHVLGALAEQVEATAEYRQALEAVLRAWLDAVVVRDMGSAIACLHELAPHAKDALRLLFVNNAGNLPRELPAPLPGAVPLRQQVKSAPETAPLLDRLLANVFVVEDLDALPHDLPAGLTCVTRDGLLVNSAGQAEIFRAAAQENPLAGKHLLLKQREQAARLAEQSAAQEQAAKDAAAAHQAIQQALHEIRGMLQEKRALLARQEGELQLIEKQAADLRRNFETVSWELRDLEQQSQSAAAKSALIEEGDRLRARRQEIRQLLEANHKQQAELEETHRQLSAEATAAHVHFARQEETHRHLQAAIAPLEERIRGLENATRERAARMEAAQAEMQEARRQQTEAENELPALEDEIASCEKHRAEIQILRSQMHATVKEAEELLRKLRAEIEALTHAESETNGKCVEQRLQRQYLIERIVNEYRISADAIQVEPEPEWPDGRRPDMETIETMIAELRAKLESMGPVNLEAIQEYKEQEERYEFLTRQQDDLVKAKQQLLDMIKTINQTTTEMFAKTFAVINENFQEIFKRLFGGGTAKLMLTDEEDILECGIEIIARPPGKKLQSVSLLSGGERTMTAVALLFAIFMVKPSPFCVLDELDAALDETNINRFTEILQDFLKKSQFVVITHNRATISAAHVLYGITMEETGVSKIISMRFKEHPQSAPTTPSAKTAEEITADAAATAPAGQLEA